MQAIQAPIKPGQSGPEVVNLQDALFALLERDIIWPLNAPDRPTPEALVKLTEGLKQERVQSLFGASTGQFVMDFQVQQGLGDHLRDVGVEETTAAKLNEWLKKLGLLDIPEPEGFVVRGTVQSADGQPLSGAVVRAFDRDLRKDQPLGEARTDDQGKYLIRYGAERFASGDVSSAIAPKLIVRAFAGDQQIGNDVVRPKPTRDEVVDFKVSAPALSEWEKVSAGVIPLLKGQGEGDQTLPPWEINDSDLNFIAEETALEREHIRLWALAFAVGRDAAEVLRPAGATDAPTLALLLPDIADDLSTLAIFYGWFRLGLPTNWEALRLQRISILRKALLDAIEQHIIPGKLREDVDNILARVPNPQIRELETVLGGAALSPEKMRAVLTQVDAVEAVSDEVLTRLVTQTAVTAQEADLVGLNVSLLRLAGGEQSIVSTMLDSEFGSVTTRKLQHARDLASLEPEDWEGVLKKTGAAVPAGMALADYARGLAIEAVAEFPQAAFKQRTTRVPAGLDAKLEKIQPLLEKNKDAITLDFEAFDLAGMNDIDRKAFREAHTNLRSFANLHPGLGLHEVLSKEGGAAAVIKQAEERIGWLRTVFELNPQVSFLGMDYLPDSADLQAIKFGSLPAEARDRVLANLKTHQRIYSVADNPIPALEIIQAGFHSASAIALAGKADFAEKTRLPKGEAGAYHATAVDQANAAASRWFKFYDVARDKATTPIRSIPSPAEFFLPLKGFAELINDQPWCACAHCQSVLSPAAYFVDLMYYIELNILSGSFKGRETHPLHLQARRPDLWELELTCKNTDEYVPYLDVVNEVLERYVRGTIPVPVGTTLDVYKHLSEQEGSFQQPFTLPIERLEILLGHFGLSRYAIAKAMGSDRTIQARARLKISQKEHDLITIERSTVDDLEFFKQLFKIIKVIVQGVEIKDPIKLSSADAVLDPMETQTFLHATGLPHEIVEAMLKTKFVNVDGSSNPEIEVVLGKLKETDVQNNSELVKHITSRRLDRIHRFARLWRKLPWTIEELDYVLMRLANQSLANAIDGSAIEKIVDLLDLNAAWSLSVDELMALSDVFPPKGLRDPTSLFDRLFNQPPFLDRDGRWLTQVVQGVPPTSIPFSHPAWKKKEAPVGAPGISDPNNNTLARLLAGLQVEDKELIKLIESLATVPAIGYQSATSTTDESILLTKESIGILYRHARLMRLLKSPVADFVKLVKLTPRITSRLPPEQYIRDLGDVNSVIEFVAWQRTSGFSPDEIRYVAHDAIPEGALDPGTLASELVASVKAGKSLEFADAVFTQIGLTDLQSRQIVKANVNTNANAFEVAGNGMGYRLKEGFNPSTTSVVTLDPSIQPPIDPPVDEKLVINLLKKYHPINVLDVALGGVLNLSPEETKVLRELAHPLVDLTAIIKALHGENPASLKALLIDVLPFRVLFKSKVFNVKSLSFIRDNKPLFFALPSQPDNQKITAHVVRNVVAYVALATSTDIAFTTASDPADISAIHEVLKNVSIVADKLLAKALRTDGTRIGALKPHLITLPSNPFDALDILARCLAFMEQLGVSGETLSLMKSDAFDDLSRAAEDVFGAFRAKYSKEKTFQEKMEPFEDKLRARKRDGLVDFIVSKWPEPFADANKLYEYFLIDVLLDGCARTSRIVAGISSLQLYVHRVLMNLERSDDYQPSANRSIPAQSGVYAYFTDFEKRKEWYWRENYRVWEANRKVFLYPENYIEPELRDDKTPLFKELEDTLLQQEISDSNVHDAYAKYLTGFDEVARLKIAGAYYHPGTKSDRGDDALHLFGVTQDAPPVYYYRVIKSTQAKLPRVSAWQKLSLQIPVRKVSPILFEGRLYVFWLEITTRPLNTFIDGTSAFGGYRHAARIKYSTLRLNGAWTPPQTLSFENGGATEDFRIINDPQIGKVDKENLEKQIAQLKLDEIEKVRLAKEAATATELAVSAATIAVAVQKEAEELVLKSPFVQDVSPFEVPLIPLANAVKDEVARDVQSGVTKVLGAGVAKQQLEALANALLSQSVVNVTISLASLTEVFDVLREALTMALAAPYLFQRAIALVIATVVAAKADAASTEAARAEGLRISEVTKVKNDIAHFQLLLDGKRISVRWDKSRRDHTEPVDGYKPEGWEWDRVYPDVYSPPNAPEAKSIRLVLFPRNPVPETSASAALIADELDLTAGVLNPTYPGGLGVFVTSFWLNHFSQTGSLVAVAFAPANADVQVVNGAAGSVISESKGDVVWLRKVPAGTYLGTYLGTPRMRKVTKAPYLGTRLGTTLTAGLINHFSREGASSLVVADVQNSLNEQRQPSSIITSSDQSELYIPENPFDPSSPYLTYFRETFFHIPFLVANHLNSQQKFAETQRWYHLIFNPTAADREPWRYREFRELKTKSLREMLGDEDALAAYREDPFNPHAIARARLTAYQKSIVMKYIDNLLDWGDSLFSQFTMESVNEATMLYVMAQDILGPRPRVLGSCGEGKGFSETNKKTYKTIRPRLNDISDFLIELEIPDPSIPPKLKGEVGRRVISLAQFSMQASTITNGSQPASTPLSIAGIGTNISTTEPSVGGRELNPTGGNYWTNVGGTPLKAMYDSGSGGGGGSRTALGTDSGAPPIPDPGNIDFGNPDSSSGGGKFGTRDGDKIKPLDKIPPVDAPYGRREYGAIEHPTGLIVPDKKRPLKTPNPVQLVPPKDLVFCIPPNKDLLAYWGRVEDRLFKIRNCMDIAGVRRKLELFAPEIDPRLLVRMKAAGLTLDDVMNATSGNLPPYRFIYLIEKARQYAGTLQSFGSQLLSAIEKRDGEELAQLRAVHEQNLLKMRSRMMQLEINAAEDSIESLRRQKTAAEYRQDYFRSLSDVGPLASEHKQQQHQREASNFRTQASVAQFIAAVLSVIPDMGAPTAMKFGGSQLGAAGRAAADGLNALAAFNEMSASMAGMEASNQRRDQEWKHQVQTAKRDISQIEKQIAAAEIRRDIAVHSLEVHDKTVDQAEELFDFFGTKFSSFGRYTFLSTQLHKLYRQSFNAALSMAKMTKQAYRAERTDDITLLDGNYWDAGNAGLLAGERLLLDLQALEQQYIEKNYRQLEIEQSFSLAQFAPDALQTFRLTGKCKFKIPEWFFDLTYPGQYRRRLKAVRLTIPCVTGPYANVGATLRLESSEIRLTVPPLHTSPPPPLPQLTSVPLRHTVKIAASKAQYDAGVFDFSFRDERYMPFEGAGAISAWDLSLPKTLRAFDYGTISDVILHLNYTAEFNEDLKALREEGAQSLIGLLRSQSMTRVFSLRQEFPDVFHRLIASPLGTEVDFTIEQRHFPFFLISGALVANAATVRFISPLASVVDSIFAIGQKVDLPNKPVFMSVKAPKPPIGELHGQGLSAFEIGNVFQGSTGSGIATQLIGDYVIKLTAAGLLAPVTPTLGGGAVDPMNLHDIVLEVAYRLAVPI